MKKSTKYTAVLVAALFAAVPALSSNTAHAATAEQNENVAVTQSSADNQTGSQINSDDDKTQKTDDQTTLESEKDGQKDTADAKADSKDGVANQDNSQNNKSNVNEDNSKNTSNRGETAENPIVLTSSYDSSLPLKTTVDYDTPYYMNVKYRENLTPGSIARFIRSKTHLYADGSELKLTDYNMTDGGLGRRDFFYYINISSDGTYRRDSKNPQKGEAEGNKYNFPYDYENDAVDSFNIKLKPNDFFITNISKATGFRPNTWYKLDVDWGLGSTLDQIKDEDGYIPDEIKNNLASYKKLSDDKDWYTYEVIAKTDKEGRAFSTSVPVKDYSDGVGFEYESPEISIYVVDPNTPGAVDIPTEFDQDKTNTSDNNSSDDNTDNKTTPTDTNNSSTPDNTDSQTSQSDNDTDTTPSIIDNTTTQNTNSTSDVKDNSNSQSTPSTDDKEVTKDNDNTTTKELTLVHNAYVYDKDGKVVKKNGKAAKLTRESKFSALNNGKTVTINGKKFYQIGTNQFVKVANADENPKQLMFTHNAYVYKKNGKLAKDKYGHYILLKKYTNLSALNNGKITTINGKKFYQIGKNQYVKVVNTGSRPKAKAVNATGKVKSSLTKVRLYNSNGKFVKKYAKSKKSLKFDQQKTIKGKKYYRIAGTNNWIRASKVTVKK